MNPLITCYEWPDQPECGGGGRVARRLAATLPAFGHEPLTHTAPGSYLTWPLRTYRELRERVATAQPDILHGHFSVPTSLLLPRVADGQPLVVTVHGSDVYNPNRFGRVRPLLDRVNAWVLDRADAVVAPSPALAARTRRLTETDVRVIPHGIDVERYEWHRRERHDPLRVLTVARLAPGKGVGTALRASAVSGLSVQHRVVGDGSERARLEQRYGDRADVEFVGWAEDPRPHYQWADVLCHPSEWESFGLTYLEALASGLPVVAGRNGGAEAIVTDSVGAVVQPTAGPVASALIQIAADYRQYQDATEEAVTDFSTTAMTQKYHTLYTELC